MYSEHRLHWQYCLNWKCHAVGAIYFASVVYSLQVCWDMSVVNTVCTSCVIECAGPLWTSEWQIYNSEVTKVFFFHVFISNYCACKHLENIGIIPMTSYKDVGSWKCIGPAQLPTTQGIGSICSRVGLKRKLIWAPRWREPDESRQWESEGGWRDIIHLVSEWHHPPGAGVTSSTWCQTGIIHPVFYTNMVLGTICPMQLMGGGGINSVVNCG